jgi:hypothetical protein
MAWIYDWSDCLKDHAQNSRASHTVRSMKTPLALRGTALKGAAFEKWMYLKLSEQLKFRSYSRQKPDPNASNKRL